MKSIIAIIFSEWSITKIHNFLHEILNKEDIGITVIERRRTKNGEYNETNKTLILMKKELFDKAVEKDTQTLDFRIEEYHIRDHHFPKENEKDNIYLRFPQELSYNDVNFQLKERLGMFKKFGVIEHYWNLVIPREDSNHRGFGYLNFTKDNLNSRAIIKVLLNDSKLYDENTEDNYHLKAFWVKNKSY